MVVNSLDSAGADKLHNPIINVRSEQKTQEVPPQLVEQLVLGRRRVGGTLVMENPLKLGDEYVHQDGTLERANLTLIDETR